MENKNQTALDSLWFGKDRNTFESLLFALFLFVFSFALATTPADTFADGAKTILGTADGIGRGYERMIARLDRNVSVLPEIAQGISREIGGRVSVVQEENRRAVHAMVMAFGRDSTRWQGLRQ